MQHTDVLFIATQKGSRPFKAWMPLKDAERRRPIYGRARFTVTITPLVLDDMPEADG